MPLLTKMTSHFRQGNGFTESQPKTIYHEDEYIPAYQHRYYVSKKYVDYSDEDLDYPLRDECSRVKRTNNEDNEDPDALYRRSREKFASWAIRDLSPKRNSEEDRASKNNKVYENFGSLKKKNEKNAGLNKGIRAIVEKLKLKSDDKKDSYKSKSKEVVDDEWRYDNGYKERKSPVKDGKTEKNHKVKEYKYEHESRSRLRLPEDDYKKSRHRESDRSKRRSYAFEASPEDFDVRIERYERAPIDTEVHRRSSFSDKRRSPSKDRRYKDSESSRRRSSSRDRNGSDESFRRDRNGSDDSFRRERNGRYEESSGSRRRRSISRDRDRRLYKESDSPKRSLSRDRDVVDRKNSFRRYNKESESPRRSSSSSPKNNNAKAVELSSKGKPPKPKISDRHSRPLTPPRDAAVMHYRESSIVDTPRKKEFSMKEWYESNRQFATKYLKENSKAKELATSDAKDEFVFELPEEARTLYETKSNVRRHSIDEASETKKSLPETSNVVKTIHEEKKRKDGSHRRRYDADAEEMENPRNYTTPSRKIWNYRDGGVHITDVDEGQPCLSCGETCSGFLPHVWRKNCTSCKCPREAHEVCHDEWVSVRARLGLKADDTRNPAGFDPRDVGLAWAPPGLPIHKVEEYFSMLPTLSVPRLGTAGERHRDRQLATQLPKQDLARAYCRHLDPQHSVSADDFMAARNEIALDIGSVQEVFDKGVECGACKEPLKYGSLAVSASKLGFLYHPTCFRCTQCEELLVDLAYCVHDDALYCERHYAEQLKPRCAACDELIFSGDYTKAMNKDWHNGHFCCWQCDESLTGQRYVLRDEHPYCIKCYESVFANGCEECHKIIGIDSKDLSYKDKHWHEACFLCSRCRVSLVDKQFGSKADKIYCGNCYDSQFASRCDGCGEIFRAGTKKMEYKTRQWHEKCFCCVVCKSPIGTKSFIPREQEIYCAGCYEDKFSTRCVKCNKIITTGGVTYKNEPWHRDCFTCTHCDQSLAGQRFTSRDDKPYCADCFGELFAKRCTACSKPITGIGGTRFISFEDRHWHNDCFICAGCNSSMVGRGFITDGEDIICPECAKQKLS